MDTSHTFVTKSARQTQILGEKIGYQLMDSRRDLTGKKSDKKKSATVLCLCGELGSGKTTFVQGIAKGLGIVSRLLSPTFIIVRRYKLPQFSGYFFHLDLYKVDDQVEFRELGLTEIFADSSSIVVIEWAEKLGAWMPKKRLDIRFSVFSDGSHEIKYQKSY